MEVQIAVKSGTGIEVLEKEYGDIYLDDQTEGTAVYYVGKWLDFDEAVALCGFAEGAIPGASVMIEGNGQWAQGMISRTDFSGLAVSKKEKLSYKRTSALFWKHFKRGQKARKTNAKTGAKL